MLSLDTFIEKLKTEPLTSKYPIFRSKIKQIVLEELENLPIIYAGIYSIDSKNPTIPIEHDLFNQHGEDLVQTFEIQIYCLEEQFEAIWKDIYKSIIGWHPDIQEFQHTGFTYAQGGVMGLENGRLFWLDRWRVGFPTVNVDV